MKRKPKHKPVTQAEQSKRFLEAAREAGVDEGEGTLEKIVKKIAVVQKKPDKKSKD